MQINEAIALCERFTGQEVVVEVTRHARYLRKGQRLLPEDTTIESTRVIRNANRDIEVVTADGRKHRFAPDKSVLVLTVEPAPISKAANVMRTLIEQDERLREVVESHRTSALAAVTETETVKHAMGATEGLAQAIARWEPFTWLTLRIANMDANDDDLEALARAVVEWRDYIKEEVVRMARLPSRSTSVLANYAHIVSLERRAEVIDGFGSWDHAVNDVEAWLAEVAS